MNNRKERKRVVTESESESVKRKRVNDARLMLPDPMLPRKPRPKECAANAIVIAQKRMNSQMPMRRTPSYAVVS